MDTFRLVFNWHSFKNPDLVTNIRTGSANEELRILINGESIAYKEVTDCKLLLLKVHFNKDSLANVLSFKQVSEIPGVNITTDTSKEDAFTVHLKNGIEMKFKCNEGLYYYDTNSNTHSKSKVNNYGVNLLNNVANNKSFYSKRQIKNAETTRHLQQCIGWPSSDAFKSYLSKTMINNSKVGMDGIQRCHEIYGPPEPLLSDKMTTPSQT